MYTARQAHKRRARVLAACVLAVACALPAGCGSSKKPAEARRTGVFGTGAERFWIFARGRADIRAVVVFLHGHGGPIEMTPTNHEPWLQHLASRDDVVVYPQYEAFPGATGTVPHIVHAVARASRLWRPRACVPLVVIGYSRGGGLAVKYAASVPAGGPVPDAVVSVFPGSSEEAPVDLRRLPRGIRIRVMVGDADKVVGSVGALAILTGLRQSGFNPAHVEVVPVRSRGGFAATHSAPFDTSPRAKREFWARTDRFIDSLRAEKSSRRANC